MGHNLYSVCHKCKTRVFHYRNEENVAILPFYIKHKQCARENLDNVQTIMDNNGTDQDWQQDGNDDGYVDDKLQPK